MAHLSSELKKGVKMFATTAQGLEVYKEELKKYVEWTEGRKKLYGRTSHPMESWKNDDYNKITAWNRELVGMERVLGLSKEEVARIGIECGFEQPTDSAA